MNQVSNAWERDTRIASHMRRAQDELEWLAGNAYLPDWPPRWLLPALAALKDEQAAIVRRWD
jgi:hypothetical protein